MFKWVSLALVATQLTAAATDGRRVCIVGAGVGGASTAHFLEGLLPSTTANVEIVVFEQAAVEGGRVATFDHAGQTIEAGGTVFLTGNKYMMAFAERLNLSLRVPGQQLTKPSHLGIFDGDSFLFESSPTSWWNTAKLMWRYGPLSLQAFQGSVAELVARFVRIYDLQDAGQSFVDPVELLRAVELFNLTQYSLEEHLLQEGIGPRLINELLAGITRVNYGQNTTMTALAGAVGLAGSGKDLRAVVGGNPQVPRLLLRHAGASVYFNTTVHAIEAAANGQWHVDTSTTDASRVHTCDAVVVATPLELTTIDVPVSVPRRPFQTTHTTFVTGSLNATRFAARAGNVPGTILTTESLRVPFSAIGLQADAGDAPPLYKVFSRTPWTDAAVAAWFVDGTAIRRYPWRAYPTYTPPETFAKFELADGLYYVNAIESAASAMEMSAVGGRNVALLVHKYLQTLDGKDGRRDDAVFQDTSDGKVEL
ncbi:Aste57867_1568 [Aphanomyces stellatus]|uniref:Aste57867_1568 protein n=1 Tax=Aphanomyces stellatus TaxID=120398 RepID=A0A485K9Q7_9STRA|nr:hypothetical protein As57867_001567 [Aphanomyces stellatus]VFT78781.1 Aste57867_1568 [Aphanomyces stellatus]